MNPRSSSIVPHSRLLRWGALFALLLLCCSAVTAAEIVRQQVTVNPGLVVVTAIPTPVRASQTVTCQAPCACMARGSAQEKWGANGFVQCNELPCGYAPATAVAIPSYCFRPNQATVVAVRPQATLTYLQTVSLPAVTTAIPVMIQTSKIPVQLVTVNPNTLCAADDKDCDGRPDSADNCPSVANPQQLDSDSYILWSTCTGTVCKMPSASDLMNCEGSPGSPLYENCMQAAWLKANPGGGCFSSLNCQHATDHYGDACDNCWEKLNPDQADSDKDCDSFRKDPSYWDGTQWLKDPQCGDACDRCPGYDDSVDTDHDGVPDGCDRCPGHDDKIDTDHDGIADGCDNCPLVYNPDQKDADKNGTGDMCQDPCSMNASAVGNFSWTTWRGTNWMTPVRDQHGCGSCWAFSTVGATEARYNIEHGKQMDLDLSEQELVSPCFGGGDAGSCTGGWYAKAIGYMTSNGLVTESDYPYLSWDEVVDDPNGHLACRVAKSHCSTPESCQDPGTPHWKLSSSGPVAGTVQDVKQALLCHGPLVVASDTWWHAIVLTGWDDTTGVWQIKNSWGKDANWSGYNDIAYTGNAHSDIINRVAWVQGVTGP